MNRVRPVRIALAGVMLAWAFGGLAQPISLASLERLLQEAPNRERRFRETRESPWLAAPIESSGSMRSSATMLEKTVEQPRRETWRILPDRLQLIAPGASAPKELFFSDVPAIAALANVLRQVMAGELQALDKDFQVVMGGDQRLWTLQMTPRRQEIARFLKQIELQGAGAQVQVIVIMESQGERTTTRLTSDP